MPVDVEAEVLSNTRLSADYNVLALAAPEVASRAEPGQFVMLKPGPCDAVLLRRPYSVFERLRDGAGRAIGITDSFLGASFGFSFASRSFMETFME